MFDQHFLSSAAPADVFGPLHGGERVMWRGRCGLAEYAFEEAASLPRWTLPESTDVLITDQRVLYAYTAADGHQVRSGELRWLWPQHLRVQPGQVSRDRGAAATQIQLVCGGSDGTYPALVFAGGDLATVADADRVANLMRQAIARFRVDNAAKLGLSTGQARMLSRLLIGPEFRNHQGGEGQTVSLLGAMPVSRPAPAPALPSIPLEAVVLLAGESATVDHEPVRIGAHAATEEVPLSAVLPETPARAVGEDLTRLRLRDEPIRSAAAFPDAPAGAVDDAQTWMLDDPARPVDEGTRLIYRPGMAADAARALMAAKAEEATQQAEPALASRAADLAARVADLVAHNAGPEPSQEHVETWDFTPEAWRPGSRSRHAEPRVDDDLRITPSAQARITEAERFEVPTTNLLDRAEAVRRTAARMASNAARTRIGARRSDRDTGISTRGNHTT